MEGSQHPPLLRRFAPEVAHLIAIVGLVLTCCTMSALVLAMAISSILVLAIGLTFGAVFKDTPYHLSIAIYGTIKDIHQGIRHTHWTARRILHQLKIPEWSFSLETLLFRALENWARNRLASRGDPATYDSTCSEGSDDWSELDSPWSPDSLPTSRRRHTDDDTTSSETFTSVDEDDCDCPCCRRETTCTRYMFARQNPSLVPHGHIHLSEADFLRSTAITASSKPTQALYSVYNQT